MNKIKRLYKLLAENLTSDQILFCESDIDPYRSDKTSNLKGNPELVILPKSTAEVSFILSTCNKLKIAVTTRGAGTGVTGGAVALNGIILSMERMNQILEIDQLNMVAIVEPGVKTADIDHAAAKVNLFYPPDPASLNDCTIGGNFAEGAGGPRAVKYGTTRDYILGAEFVLADGSVQHCGGKFVKNATGYNITSLLIGSEGTLAVVTKIYLKLISRPKASIDLLIPFDSINAATQGVARILQGSVLPATIEFIERDALSLVAHYLPESIPFANAGAHLLVQLDGRKIDDIEKDLTTLLANLQLQISEILVGRSDDEKTRLWKTRRSIREAVHSINPVVLAEDCVVPRAQIPDFIADVKEFLALYKAENIMFGHAGDGNVHINILKKDFSDNEWESLLPAFKNGVYSLAIKYGGTISGEHGTGSIRRDYLPLAFSAAEIVLFENLKKAFDPNGILNPGKIVR